MEDAHIRLERTVAITAELLDELRHDLDATSIMVADTDGRRARTLARQANAAQLTAADLVDSWRAAYGDRPRSVVLVGESIRRQRSDQAANDAGPDDLETLRAAIGVYAAGVEVGDLDEAHAVLANLTEDQAIREERDRLRRALADFLGDAISSEYTGEADSDAMISAIVDYGPIEAILVRLSNAVDFRSMVSMTINRDSEAKEDIDLIRGIDAIRDERDRAIQSLSTATERMRAIGDILDVEYTDDVDIVREVREAVADAAHSDESGRESLLVGDICDALGLSRTVNEVVDGNLCQRPAERNELIAKARGIRTALQAAMVSAVRTVSTTAGAVEVIEDGLIRTLATALGKADRAALEAILREMS